MAKTKAKAKQPNRGLDKTIKVNGEIYNVNAVEATHVQNKLRINKHDINGLSTDTVAFDGSNAETVDIVPVSGGAYAGPIRVPNIKDSSGRPNANAEIINGFLEINDKAVLNYDDTINIIARELTKNSVFYNFTLDGDDGHVSPEILDGAISGVSIINGKSFDIGDFLTYNEKERLFPAFLYVCNDADDADIDGGDSIVGGNIYYGTLAVDGLGKIHHDVYRLARHSETTKKLVAHRMQGESSRLEYTAESIKAAFDNVSKKILSNESILTEQIQNLSDDLTYYFEQKLNEWLDNLEAGGIIVGKAKQDEKGTSIRNGYYRTASIGKMSSDGKDFLQQSTNNSSNTITISVATPSNDIGVDGDIWIRYL